MCAFAHYLKDLQTLPSSEPTHPDQTTASPSSAAYLPNSTTNIPRMTPSIVQLGGSRSAVPNPNPLPKSNVSSAFATVLSINGSRDLQTFSKAFIRLAMKDNHGKSLRQNAWREADPNRNGYVSLAEFDAWIKKHLSSTPDIHADHLWRLYRPCYIRAHADAADIMMGNKVCWIRVGRVSTSSHDNCIQQLPD